MWRGELDKNVHDEQEHSVNVRWSNETILMTIDGGACADFRQCNLQVRSAEQSNRYSIQPIIYYLSGPQTTGTVAVSQF